MNLKARKAAFTKVGTFINDHFQSKHNTDEHLHLALAKIIDTVHIYNGWFSPNFVKEAIANIGSMLNEQELEKLTLKETENPKTVAIICAGNIPMVGFHDIMCVLLSGHNALIKLSADDNILLPFFLKLLVHFEPAIESQIAFAGNKLSAFDAVIATGTNNTASHFNYYFEKYPKIIRRNRSSVGVLTGNESTDQLKALGKDIFTYYGLGCRNVSKLFVPRDYSFDKLFESIIEYGFVIDNNKYGNNYEYHRAIFLLEQHQFLDNNFLIIKENDALHSPVGVLHYERYDDINSVKNYLKENSGQIQCIVGEGFVPFGYSQRPVITDFADNVNTCEFLVTL